MIASYKHLSRRFCFIFPYPICTISKFWEQLKNFGGRKHWINSISSSLLEQFYSFRAQTSHYHIIRNGFLNRKQWTFSFKKQCSFGAKMLNFRVSEAGLLNKLLNTDLENLTRWFNTNKFSLSNSNIALNIFMPKRNNLDFNMMIKLNGKVMLIPLLQN